MLYTHTVSPQPSPSTPRSIKLPTLIHPKHRTRNTRQKHQVPRRQPLGLENPLQKRQVDHRHLPQQAAPNGEIKHLIADKVQLPAEHALALAAAGERVEHVEEDEAGEGHGGVARVDGVVDGHFADVDDDGAEHDDGGGGEDALDEGAGEDAGGAGAGGAGHDGWVDGLDAEGLRGGAVHEDIWRRFSAWSNKLVYESRGALLIHRICIAFRGFLKPRKVLRRTRDKAATLVLSWKVMKFWML